jgi:hypothetical protein
MFIVRLFMKTFPNLSEKKKKKGRGMGGVMSARNERHTVSPEILKKERRKGDGGWS